ncbi:PQQ-dependent sugar dehydrogenase [Nonomuraea aurantiaca]|uniref:PQQ-dependent sugar dehydrogenase n=1 Tax=Nonomuraea aurantiaca TaxID=2878562 RepID=UPI001CDA0735|nr:PQQ-dependent sugar dehydrogenase [Nonomuraea aurantiaca]MCA2222978.1 PQQ-dependent sugar dehydrogenase [Nonomuraea aurantiaca]
MEHMGKLMTLMLLAVLTACSSAGGAVPDVAVAAAPPPGAPKTVARDLAVPWGIAFVPGGDALVTERDTARLLRATPAGKVTELGRIAGVTPDGEGGLMGVAVKGNQVFVYFTAADDNRIVRYRFTGDTVSDPRVILRGIPKGAIHNGGRLAFGPDGFLYATTGETGDRQLAQRRDSLGGKILRMTVDGAPAPGNPFGTLVYSLGHRNVQGLAWDPAGRLYASEFGQNAFDEVNLIKPGANYGWPEVEGKADDPRFVNPIITWPTSEASPSGAAYAAGSLWVAALRGERLWQIPLGRDGSPGTPVAHFTGTYGRLRGLATAPDGTLWLSTSNKDGRGDPRDGDDRILSVNPSRP